MKVDWATYWQIPEALEFVLANAVKGNLDHRIFHYPTIRIMRAENGAGNAICCLPVHSGAILETMGWASDLDADEKVTAGIAVLEQIELEAQKVGCREVIFISSDPRVDEFSERWLGYEKVSAMRKRL